MNTEEVLSGLKLLRAPFPDNQISLLPKPTKKREEMDKLQKAKCKECGGWHATTNIIHLSYVGHAALTDRLLDADPAWFWEPLYLSGGLPAFDDKGGLWIRLTVCGVSRLGYGHAGDKLGGDAVKEVIGDALRNAAMRFGAALELWHKGELHVDEEPKDEKKKETPGQLVDQDLAISRLTPEVAKAIRDESAKISADFYTIGVKAALGSWTTFEKSAGEDEIDALWKLLDSAVRSGIRKALEAPKEDNGLKRVVEAK